MSVYLHMRSDTEADIRAAADRWYARLRASDCTPRERAEFGRWRAADPAHARAFADTERTWNSIDDLEQDEEMQAWLEEARQAAQQVPQRRQVLRLAAVAAVAVLSVGVGLLMARGDSYSTERGEQKQVSLPDGSTLVLNTDSKVRVLFGNTERNIELVRGEALFTVTHDSTRPFRVRAGGDTITDLGTRFEVKLTGDASRVSVLEGKVEVARDAAHVAVLTGGERIQTDMQGWPKQLIEVSSLALWSQGRLLFHDTSLTEVVAELNRYGPGRVVLADPALAELRVSGDFKIAERDTVLRALQAAFPIRVESQGEQAKLYRN